MSGKGRGQHRKNCLLAFIEDCLNDPSMNHLIRWLDKQKEIFRVLWVHAGRSNYYRKTQGCLFDLYREYRGRGMTSDPKQAFRMALKKSPCIKAVSSPNIQEDWRTFQIVLKCHQNSSGSSECISEDTNTRRLKELKSENINQMEESNVKLTAQTPIIKEVEKNISDGNKSRLHEINYEKSIETCKSNNNDEVYSNLTFQEGYFNYSFPNSINNCQETESNKNDDMVSFDMTLKDDTICCKNPCCRYSTNSNKMLNRLQNVSPKISPPMSQINISTFSSPIVNNSQSNNSYTSYIPASIAAQNEYSSLVFDSNVCNWNTKANYNQNFWKGNISQQGDYTPFQSTSDYDYNNQALNSTKCSQSVETDLLTSCYKPGDDLSFKTAYIGEYDYISHDHEQDIDFYPKLESYSKTSYQYPQSMISCNWMM